LSFLAKFFSPKKTLLTMDDRQFASSKKQKKANAVQEWGSFVIG
jgi:hypothetical protein